MKYNNLFNMYHQDVDHEEEDRGSLWWDKKTSEVPKRNFGSSELFGIPPPT